MDDSSLLKAAALYTYSQIATRFPPVIIAASERFISTLPCRRCSALRSKLFVGCGKLLRPAGGARRLIAMRTWKMTELIPLCLPGVCRGRPASPAAVIIPLWISHLWRTIVDQYTSLRYSNQWLFRPTVLVAFQVHSLQ